MRFSIKHGRLASFATVALAFAFLLSPMQAFAEPAHKVVIQVNAKNKVQQKIALLHAGNLKSQLGADNVTVEVVTFGPGIAMLKADSVFASRIARLQGENVTFSVCEGTLKSIVKKTGKEPDLLDNITRVRTGGLRLMELQEQGYSYLSP